MEVFHIRHLDHKQHPGPIAFLCCLGKMPQMFRAPLRGGIREGADPIRFQGHALYFQEMLFSILPKGKIEPGIPVFRFGFPFFRCSQATGPEPFPGSDVGSLGIHIDEPLPFSHRNEVEFCLAVGVVGPLAPDLRPREQQLPAAACVFHMADLHLSIDLHVGHKPVRSSHKNPRHHIFIFHTQHFL